MAHDLKGDGIAVAILHPGERRAFQAYPQVCWRRGECTNEFPTRDEVSHHRTAADDRTFHVNRHFVLFPPLKCRDATMLLREPCVYYT